MLTVTVVVKKVRKALQKKVTNSKEKHRSKNRVDRQKTDTIKRLHFKMFPKLPKCYLKCYLREHIQSGSTSHCVQCYLLFHKLIEINKKSDYNI